MDVGQPSGAGNAWYEIDGTYSSSSAISYDGAHEQIGILQ